MWTKRLLIIGLLGVLIVGPANGQDKAAPPKKPAEAKSEKGKNEDKKPERRETYRYLGQISGTVKDISDANRMITLEMRGATPSFIPTHYWRGLIRGTFVPNQQVYDLDIMLADDVKVRIPYKPERDEKGKIKPFKPDPDDRDRHLGGIKGSESDLARRQFVTVHLGLTTSDPRNPRIVATAVIVVNDVPGR